MSLKYILLFDGAEWEDIKIFDTYEDALSYLREFNKQHKKESIEYNYRIEKIDIPSLLKT
jgi:viroplasmin and RNaseH domain-containing protein